MNNIITTEKYFDYTIEISYENDPTSPREWDTLGTIYSAHRDINPDGHRISELYNEDGYIDEKALSKEYIFVNIYCYEHTGIRLWAGHSDPDNNNWDSGFFGIIAVKKTDAEKQLGSEQGTNHLIIIAETHLKLEIADLDQYYSGEIYEYTCKDKSGQIIDTCGGYYDEDECLSDAKSTVERIYNREMHFETILSACGID